jgi:hypothetical protein
MNPMREFAQRDVLAQEVKIVRHMPMLFKL